MSNTGFKFIPNTGTSDVWCPTTESATWIAIENNKSYLTGNSTSNISLQNISSDTDFRSCFIPEDGHTFYSSDLSGVELYLLGVHIAPFDNGEFLEAVTHGKKEDKTDIHNVNARKGGVSRSDAKQLIYSILYGSSGLLVGHNLWTKEVKEKVRHRYTDEELDDAEKTLMKRHVEKDGFKYARVKKGLWLRITHELKCKYLYGNAMSKSFKDGFTGLTELESHLASLYKGKDKGITIGLGKRIWFKDARTALNYTLQGSNAYITKLWLFFTHQEIRRRGMSIPNDYIPLTLVHDEINISLKDKSNDVLSVGINMVNKSLRHKYDIGTESFMESDWSYH